MPIIIPTGETDGLYQRLAEAGAAVISQEEAGRQDIRPARIGLLNLMPAVTMERTETQWLRYMSHSSVLQIEPILVKFDDDPRATEGASRAQTLCRYKPFSQVAEEGLDGLIVTGDNLELDPGASKAQLLPFDAISYADSLREVMDWANQSVYSTIYSCLASHFALDHFFEMERVASQQKVFGVYQHNVIDERAETFVEGMDDVMLAPHSRWGDVPLKEFLDRPSIKLLAYGAIAGWLLASVPNAAGGEDLFVQGHPEYDRNDLETEHARDGKTEAGKPVGYYNEDGHPSLSWANSARAVHANWISFIYRQTSLDS